MLSLTDIPFTLYSVFVLEEKFGFNKQTLKIFIEDFVKEILVSVVLEVPLFAALFKIFHAIPETWWIWSFFLVFGFQLVMIVLYPKLIMPLFNKLIPLKEFERLEAEKLKKDETIEQKIEETETIAQKIDQKIEEATNSPLQDRIVKLLERCGFFSFTIEVMDGSTRSAHSNAMFTGLGSKFKRIILYDTLIHQLGINHCFLDSNHLLTNFFLSNLLQTRKRLKQF